MASIKDLKKDVNNVLGDLIEAVYIVDAANGKQDSKEGAKIVDSAIETFDDLIVKINTRKVKDKKKHFKALRAELETKAKGLVDQINKLS